MQAHVVNAGLGPVEHAGGDKCTVGLVKSLFRCTEIGRPPVTRSPSLSLPVSPALQSSCV